MAKYGEYTAKQFTDKVVESCVLAGIATAEPDAPNLDKAATSVTELKRMGGCYISGTEEWKKKMPMFAQMEQEWKPKINKAQTKITGFPSAEIIRHALRETILCCLESAK